MSQHDEKRRGLLLAGLGVAACSTIPRSPCPSIAALCSPYPGRTLVSQDVLNAWSNPARYFDAHTHFFNAQDVPVRNFLELSTAHGLASQSIRDLIKALAPVAERLAYLAPTPSEEMKALCSGSTFVIAATELDARIDSEINEHQQRVARELDTDLKRNAPQVIELINGAAAGMSLLDVRMRSMVGPTSYSLEYLLDAFASGGGVRAEYSLVPPPANIQALIGNSLSIKGVLQFVFFMLSARRYSVRTFIKNCSQSSPEIPLSGCIAALVDFDYWLDGPDKSSNKDDQLRVHEQLALASGGFLMPLVPYNPWQEGPPTNRDRNESLDRVEKAIKEQGFVGVKMYPPMGFRPYGNDDKISPTPETRLPDLVALDRRMQALYELCDGLEVPVMAHGSHSNGLNNAYDDQASPVWWDKASKIPSLKQLHVNIGHFGGAPEKDSDTSSPWMHMFALLMSSSSRVKFYGDLGYWDEFLKNPEVADRLAKEMSRPLATGGTVADRVMYGSDWHMLSKEPGWPAYPQIMKQILAVRAPSGSEWVGKVFGRNLMACYGLDATSTRKSAYDRLRQYYINQTGSAPGWM